MKPRSDFEIWQATTSPGYIGGGYYNPLEEFLDLARSLNSEALKKLSPLKSPMSVFAEESTFFVFHLYDELLSLTASQEMIFGVYDRGSYQFAVAIPNHERLMDFEVQVNQGTLVRRGFFALGRKEANVGLMRAFRPAQVPTLSRPDLNR